MGQSAPCMDPSPVTPVQRPVLLTPYSACLRVKPSYLNWLIRPWRENAWPSRYCSAFECRLLLPIRVLGFGAVLGVFLRESLILQLLD